MDKVDQDRIQKMYSPLSKECLVRLMLKTGTLIPPSSPCLPATRFLRWELRCRHYQIPTLLISMSDTKSDTLSLADNHWASGYELYDRLSAPYKRFFESLTATHKSTALSQAAKDNPENGLRPPRRRRSSMTQVWISSRTTWLYGRIRLRGGRAASVNCFRIDDVTDMESAHILDKITRLIINDQDIQCRFRWEDVNDPGESASSRMRRNFSLCAWV